MRWRTHAELPATTDPITALISVPLGGDEPGAYHLVAMLYIWRDGRWVSEETGKPIQYREFWWMPEVELVAWLRAAP